MTQEDKELLLKDLCARLPYGVKGIVTFHKSMSIDVTDENPRTITPALYAKLAMLQDSWYDNIPCIKPYLRPMSSMTKDEEKMFLGLKNGLTFNYATKKAEYNMMSIDWLNAHHFDYRGLIDKGMALVAPNGMYN